MAIGLIAMTPARMAESQGHRVERQAFLGLLTDRQTTTGARAWRERRRVGLGPAGTNENPVSVVSLLTRPMRPLTVSSALGCRVEAMLGRAAKAIDPSSNLRFMFFPG